MIYADRAVSKVVNPSITYHQDVFVFTLLSSNIFHIFHIFKYSYSGEYQIYKFSQYLSKNAAMNVTCGSVQEKTLREGDLISLKLYGERW